jgi:hypothetical protein
MLNRHRVGLIFLFFMPALWQVQRVKPTLFSISRGMAVDYVGEWCAKHQWAVGVGEMAAVAALVAAGIKLGHIHPGTWFGTKIGGFNGAFLGGGAAGGSAGGIAGAILGGIGVATGGDAIGIPAWLLASGGAAAFGASGYAIGDAVHKFLNPAIDIGQVFAGGSLLTIGVALIIDGARRFITDEAVKRLFCNVKDGVVYLAQLTADVVADSWVALKGHVVPNGPADGIGSVVSSVAVGGTGAAIGGSVAAGTVTVLGSHAIGGIALSLGLVSAPLWPVIACGAGGAALGYGAWKLIWSGR